MTEKLKLRFLNNMHRHQSLKWDDVEKLLTKEVLDTIQIMEQTNGQPDVFVIDDKLYYIDAVKELPIERMNVCYDEDARLNRKKFPPEKSVEIMLENTKLTLLTEQQYLAIQTLEDFDLKTSSWLLTNKEIRDKGGALFGSKKYGRTFVYHNGADAYYSTRAYRTIIAL